MSQRSKRSVKPNRQQLVVVIGDNSGSMRGLKAEAATDGIRKMIIQCQSRSGSEESLYRVLFISFGNQAVIDKQCRRTPVLEVDTNQVSLRGDGGGTNLREALELAHSQISEYLDEIEGHPQQAKHPLPLVILFSDGRNGDNFGRPEAAAESLKELQYDSEEILILTAGVAVADGDNPDEQTLKAIASHYKNVPLYVPIEKADMLSRFLAAAGSSAASTSAEVYDVIRGFLEAPSPRRLT